MSPLNSNSKIFSLYNKSKQCYNHSSKMFSFLFFFFQSMYCLFKKKCSFFLSFFSMCCVQQYSSFSFLFFFHFHCPVAFYFCFGFHFFSFFFIINCSFNVPCFSNLISTSLCPYLNTNYRFASQFIQFQSIVP